MKHIFALLLISACLLPSCQKQDDFLNARRSISDIRPSTLTDFQAILDNNNMMNALYPIIGMAGTDNFYVPDDLLPQLDQVEVAAYLWQKDIWQNNPTAEYEWGYAYQIVEFANIALDGLSDIKPDNQTQASYNNIKGSALFYRTICFYALAQDFCKPFDSATSATDLGIPVRTSSDVNVKSTRGTVQETYDRMIEDLTTAIPLLPDQPQRNTLKMRPSKASANALLAKIYLSMRDYNNAEKYSRASLSEYNTLMDYNDLNYVDTTSTFTFQAFPNNPEVIFYAEGNGEAYSMVNPAYNASTVDTVLYNSYDPNDIRRAALYYLQSPEQMSFKGTYTGNSYPFEGIATNEVYLIHAESSVRIGKVSDGLDDLNTLLATRYQTGTYVPVPLSDASTALDKILLERRKELPYTGQLRWEDLRRLNKDPKYAVTLTRISNGVTYTLPPNDPKYVLPIPSTEAKLSGLAQNDR